MNSYTGRAPGKVILFGEHAVVYGRPAIAAPVTQVQVLVKLIPEPETPQGSIRIESPATEVCLDYDHLDESHPLHALLENLDKHFGHPTLPGFQVEILSDIPIAAGMGSGAALSVAMIRAYAMMVGKPISPQDVSALSYEIEKIYHGTPSGIDNTVITYEIPILYQRLQPILPIQVHTPFRIIIADTGVKKETARVVGEVRDRWSADHDKYEQIFTQIGGVVAQARLAIETGRLAEIGPLMNRNQALLTELDVSCPEIDRLVTTALDCGAEGAKLCGAGKGGNIVIFPGSTAEETIVKKLMENGAINTICTTIRNPEGGAA